MALGRDTAGTCQTCSVTARDQHADTCEYALSRARRAARKDAAAPIWSVGGSPGTHKRTIYREDEMVGVMFDGELSEHIVALLNQNGSI